MKKGLSFAAPCGELQRTGLSTCGATFAWSLAGPTREHAITCSASNAGSRSRYSALALRLRPFPFPSAIHLPPGVLRDSQQRPLSVSARMALLSPQRFRAIRLVGTLAHESEACQEVFCEQFDKHWQIGLPVRRGERRGAFLQPAFLLCQPRFKRMQPVCDTVYWVKLKGGPHDRASRTVP